MAKIDYLHWSAEKIMQAELRSLEDRLATTRQMIPVYERYVAEAKIQEASLRHDIEVTKEIMKQKFGVQALAG